MKIVEIDEMSLISVLANFTSEEIKIIKKYNQLICEELDKVSDDES